MNDLANLYAAQGKYAEGEALFRKTLAVEQRVLGAEHPDTLSTLSFVAFMYEREGKYAAAESYAARVLAARRRTLGPDDGATMDAAADLALAYLSQTRFSECEGLAREAVVFDQKNRPDDWQTFRAETMLGASLSDEKKYSEAEPLLLAGYQGMLARKDRIPAPNHYHLDRAREWIVQLYESWDKPDKAGEWKKK